MKTELQKMLGGELYLANDPELIDLRIQARKLFTQYNLIPVQHGSARRTLLKQLLGAIGGNADIQTPFYCDYGVHFYAGENLFMNFNCIILDCAKVVIGDNVMMGPNVQIYTAYHPLSAMERIKGPELASAIMIGNNVWIGGGAVICPGLTIGDNTTIGAGSVVTKDIPSNVLAAGNPCRVIKKIG
ncbi:MAG: sugar O-acetyltransferase [Chitinophagaceae bacterium]